MGGCDGVIVLDTHIWFYFINDGPGKLPSKARKAVKDNDADLGDQKIIQNRLIFRLLNEAVACLNEGIVGDKDSMRPIKGIACFLGADNAI